MTHHGCLALSGDNCLTVRVSIRIVLFCTFSQWSTVNFKCMKMHPQYFLWIWAKGYRYIRVIQHMYASSLRSLDDNCCPPMLVICSGCQSLILLDRMDLNLPTWYVSSLSLHCVYCFKPPPPHSGTAVWSSFKLKKSNIFGTGRPHVCFAPNSSELCGWKLWCLKPRNHAAHPLKTVHSILVFNNLVTLWLFFERQSRQKR